MLTYRQNTVAIAVWALIQGSILSPTPTFAAHSSARAFETLKNERRQLISEIDGWMSSDYSNSELVQLRIKRKRDRLLEIERILASHEDEEHYKLHDLISEALHSRHESAGESHSLLNQDTRTTLQMLADGDKPGLFGAVSNMVRNHTSAENPDQVHPIVHAADESDFKVLSKNLGISLPQYFELLNDPPAFGLDVRHQIVFDELARICKPLSNVASATEKEEVVDIMKSAIAHGRLSKGVNRFLLEAWLKLPLSSQYLNLTQEALTLMTWDQITAAVPAAVAAIGQRYESRDAALVSELLSLKNPQVDLEIAKNVITRPGSIDHPEWVEALTGLGRGESPLYQKEARILAQSQNPRYLKIEGMTPFRGVHPAQPPYPIQATISGYSGHRLQAEIFDEIVETLSSSSWIDRHPDLLKTLLRSPFNTALTAKLEKTARGKDLLKRALKNAVQQSLEPVVKELKNSAPQTQEIPQNLTWSRYFDFLTHSDPSNQKLVHPPALPPTAADEEAIYPIVLRVAKTINPNDNTLPVAIAEWMKLPISQKYPEVTRLVFARASASVIRGFAVLNGAAIFRQPGGPELLVERQDPYIDQVLSTQIVESTETPESVGLIKKLLDPFRSTSRAYQAEAAIGFVRSDQLRANVLNIIIGKLIVRPDWIDHHPEMIDWMLSVDDLTLSKAVAGGVIPSPRSENHFEWVKKLLKGPDDGYLKTMLFHSLSNSHWFPRFREIPLLLSFIDRPRYWKALVSNPEWLRNRPNDVEALIDLNNPDLNWLLASEVLSQKQAVHHVDWFKKLYLNMREKDRRWILEALRMPHWAESHPELISFVIENGCDLQELDRIVLSEPHWKKSPVLRKMIPWGTLSAKRLKAALDRKAKNPAPNPLFQCIAKALSRIELRSL